VRVWRLMKGWRGAGVNKTDDPGMEEIAGAICHGLEELGLYARPKLYWNGFCEIIASSSPKMITLPDGKEASGLALLLARRYDPPTLVFEEINSLRPGLGRQMVGAVLAVLKERPGLFERIRVDDASPRLRDGRRWWEHIASDYPEFDWQITNDAVRTSPVQRLKSARRGAISSLWRRLRVATRRRRQSATVPSQSDAPGGYGANGRDFVEKQRKLEALAREFGFDPSNVTLSPQKEAYEYLGQSFTPEGEAWPDGRIEIYYDPKMSDARLGCCLAHEIQHVRYFAVGAAYRAELTDGPLHRRFAKFTPELLAAQRGVSDYSNEHWDAWRGESLPELFGTEVDEGQSEPINETIAEVAKAQFNWGPDVRINPIWRELLEAINEEYTTIANRVHDRSSGLEATPVTVANER
jgi:hypothetical protein